MKFTRLPVCFVPGLVRLAEVEKQLVGALLGQLLHDVERALAEGLAHRVEEHKHQVRLLACTRPQPAVECGTAPSKESVLKCAVIPNQVMALFTSKG